MPPETDNLKLEGLFQEDQTDRADVLRSQAELLRLKDRDRDRRKQVYAMMEMGEVRTKNDLYHAAVVLHHGEDPADFVTAHRLGALAAAMGHRSARFVMAATLDRYLMSVGLPQVYGTQFEFSSQTGRYELKLPMEEGILLDFEKAFLGVPTIADRLTELNRKVQQGAGAGGQEGPARLMGGTANPVTAVDTPRGGSGKKHGAG